MLDRGLGEQRQRLVVQRVVALAGGQPVAQHARWQRRAVLAVVGLLLDWVVVVRHPGDDPVREDSQAPVAVGEAAQERQPLERLVQRRVHPPRGDHAAQAERLEADHEHVRVHGLALQPRGQRTHVAGMLLVWQRLGGRHADLRARGAAGRGRLGLALALTSA